MNRHISDVELKASRLRELARAALIEHGMLPEFPNAVRNELAQIPGPAQPDWNGGVKDLRDMLWCSIDNDSSKDLDQLSASMPLPDGATRIFVAIADVDALVRKGSSIDLHASRNTCSIYTPAQIFPMIPERLSNDISSLNYDEDRMALVVQYDIAPDGTLAGSDLFRAAVRNKAKLAYSSIGAWLDGRGELPSAAASAPGLAESLIAQDAVAQKLKKLRHENGALDLESPDPKPAIEGGRIYYGTAERGNRAKLLIEDFMIAANGVGARMLAAKGFPAIRRIVKTPKRWERIVELARERNYRLPSSPDSKALEAFLEASKPADPVLFQELSFNVMKLLGPGEYAVEDAKAPKAGHFGLAVKDYAHSTAPNRRYADLVTHRLFKAALAGRPCPYDHESLEAVARRCTLMEDAAKKVERRLNKSAVALMLEDRIGETFDAIVTGASPKGTWVRISAPPVEGRLDAGYEGLDVGDRCRVRLVHTDPEKGYIDFRKVRS